MKMEAEEIAERIFNKLDLYPFVKHPFIKIVAKELQDFAKQEAIKCLKFDDIQFGIKRDDLDYKMRYENFNKSQTR